MTHGIIKGKANMLGGEKEDIEDWRDEVVHYYSVGNMMYELYISPEILSSEEMDVLGNVTKWAIANAHPLLDNTTMVGGDPAQREPYGYVHSSAQKSIITLRNPFVRPRTMKLKIDEENGFQKFEGIQSMFVIYPTTFLKSHVKFGDTLTFDLDGYEEIVAQMLPGFADEQRAIFGGSGSGTPHPQLTFSPARLLRSDDEAVLLADADVPPGYAQAKFAVLLEPEKEVSGIKAGAKDSGQELQLTTENGGHASWYWFSANLAPGKHTIELRIPLHTSAHLSAWLITSRDLGRFGTGPTEIFPTGPHIQRRTHLLLEETIR
jgi:hypothetical protein